YLASQPMKQLQVPYYFIEDPPAALTEVSSFLDSINSESIDTAPWKQYNYKPTVRFAIAHSGNSILLKYYVTEKDVRTVFTEVNDPVYRDSCVEFFIALEDDDNYYNFEFNSNGVCLASYGDGRENRKMLPIQSIRQIKCLKMAPRAVQDQNHYWELCIVFPLSIFYYHQLADISGKLVKANFYKCGDEVAEPHFLVWNNITSAEPDFHLPQFFGTLIFDPTSIAK
ncbi:MAG TPA: carbohydrate-binding family 9-like protein, partial [Daejeonella sp.]|nr:carbohydrate-binding family 9-like protein [Daejeonella sp.]